ncbi:gamma-butyrobetaine dioxygenase [Rubricella aquisinus]|uniref:Gamma-butyrobetaine dioxygenase n=1 Tax=Rubricella aquisinus TaxID=2028108 RepID=A0A840X4L6_9RHOB|nr:TauD/TfdA family dioxygenase [Rubricella aquisinus]MBB5516746.1 gamma-butyrobetaine dioxygenase [Rubricella aquisinus]
MDSDISLGSNGLTLTLDGQEAYFNACWLRDACTSCIDRQTRERIFDASSLPDLPHVTRAWIEGDSLRIAWRDEAAVGTVPLDLLRHVAAHGRPHDPAHLPRTIWMADFEPRITRVSQHDMLHDEVARAQFCRAMITDGIAIVTDMEPGKPSLTALVETMGHITPSAEGFFFEVRVEIAPTNLAFTAGALEMHTDLPGEEAAPGLQFLHCLENTVEGGLSLFLDGAAVAEALRAEDPEAFDLLATHSIPFFYRHDRLDYRAHQRVIELDQQGRVTGVTISQHLLDTMDLPQHLLDSYYPAFIKFIRMMQEDRFVMRFRSQAGNCVVFDNHRIVHGREGYIAESGRRHLRGCYMDRGALRSTYRVLAKRGFDGIAAPALETA